MNSNLIASVFALSLVCGLFTAHAQEGETQESENRQEHAGVQTDQAQEKKQAQTSEATGQAGERDGDSVAENLSEANKEGRIWAAFALNPELNPFEFTIEVNGDVATIGGKVDDEYDRELAERVALDISGVKRVVNNVQVDRNWTAKKQGAAEPSLNERWEDATITARVKSRLLWSDATEGLAINVDTRGRRVTLSGEVDTQQAKESAVFLAENTKGVRGVVDRLTVAPAASRQRSEHPVDDAWITTKVKSSLLYSNGTDGLDINVDTTNGVVTLSGKADSEAEKALAEQLARNVRGVKQVNTQNLIVSVQQRPQQHR